MISDITELWKAAATAAFKVSRSHSITSFDVQRNLVTNYIKGGKCAYGAIESPTNATSTTKRTASGPAPFGKPRFTIPKKIGTVVPPKKREVAQKNAVFMANQFMKVVD